MALPVAAIVSIVLGCWVLLVLGIFALYQFFKGRGNCDCECAPCGKEDTPACGCCVSLSEACNCCNPSLNGCLNSVCPANKQISCIDIVLCTCCNEPGDRSCCLKDDCREPICGCGGGPKCQFDMCKCDDEPEQPAREWCEWCRSFTCCCMSCECRTSAAPHPLSTDSRHMVNPHMSACHLENLNKEVSQFGMAFEVIDGVVRLQNPNPRPGASAPNLTRPSFSHSGLNPIYSPHHLSPHTRFDQPRSFHNTPRVSHDETRLLVNEPRGSHSELREPHESRSWCNEPRGLQSRDAMREVHVDPDVQSDVMRPVPRPRLQRNWRDMRAAVPEMDEEFPAPRTRPTDI